MKIRNVGHSNCFFLVVFLAVYPFVCVKSTFIDQFMYAMADIVKTLHNRDWTDVLSNIDPFAYAGLGSALALTLCVIGAAW